MSSNNESDAEPLSNDMLEDICDIRKYNPIINSKQASYKIHDLIKQRRAEQNGALSSTQKMVKGSQKLFKDVINEFLEEFPIMV